MYPQSQQPAGKSTNGSFLIPLAIFERHGENVCDGKAPSLLAPHLAKITEGLLPSSLPSFRRLGIPSSTDALKTHSSEEGPQGHPIYLPSSSIPPLLSVSARCLFRLPKPLKAMVFAK